jgi:glycerophosphoryl diester phosphodiesterase
VIRPRLGWSLPRVFAHRCGGALAPENTLAGLRIAARMGVRAVEFDVMLSADCSPWLLHDERLERTSSGVRAGLRDAAMRHLRTLDAGAHQHPAFIGESIPSPRVSSACSVASWAFWPTSKSNRRPALRRSPVRSLPGRSASSGRAPSWPLVSSFSEDALLAARAAAPELPLGALYERSAGRLADARQPRRGAEPAL